MSRAKPGKKSEAKKTTTKKAFALGRDSVYVADPIKDLRICGARGVVPADEAGDLDTPPGPDIPVKDLRRLRRPLSPVFVENIDRRTVRTPIVIAKIDDVATVIAGKRRARAARRGNRRRMKDGRPLMKVRCVMQRETDAASVLATVISENNNRTDDTLADKVEKLRAYLALGPSEEDAAVEFGVGVDRVREWLAYDDQALDAVKKAVEDERIPASTGLELARIRDADKQRAALEKILVGAGVRDRSARAARALAQGAEGRPTATDRKSQRMLLDYLQKPDPDRHRGSTADQAFWRGVVDALRIVTGQEASDPRVAQALAEARSATAPKKKITRESATDDESATEDEDGAADATKAE